MFTTKQAWMYLETIWSYPVSIPGRNVTSRSGSHGLCGDIMKMWVDGTISDNTRRTLLTAIDHIPREKTLLYGPVLPFDVQPFGFVWPCTLEGARQRVEFCHQQAQLCMEET